jgi:hypothetical protein
LIRGNFSFEFLLGLVEFTLTSGFPLLNVGLRERNRGGGASEHGYALLKRNKLPEYADALKKIPRRIPIQTAVFEGGAGRCAGARLLLLWYGASYQNAVEAECNSMIC